MTGPDFLTYTWDDAPSDWLARVLVEDDIRDALQCVRVSRPSRNERARLLELDARAGVHTVFLGFPAISDSEKTLCTDLLRHIGAHQLPVVPVLMSRAVVADLDCVLEARDAAGVDAIVDLFVATSPLRLKIEGWELLELLGRLEHVAARATESGLRFRIAFEDSTRTPPADLRRAVKAALAWRPEEIVLNDTVGACLPSGAARHAAFVKDIIKQSGLPTGLTWHGHNDMGLSLPNALAAAKAGATLISGTFLGIGERAGNVPLEQVIHLATRGGSRRYDLPTVVSICDLVASSMAVDPAADQPLVGRDVFTTATGTHAAAIAKAAELGREFEDAVFSEVAAEHLGRHQTIVVGPSSGRRGVRAALERASLPATDRAVANVLAACEAQGRYVGEPSEIMAMIERRPSHPPPKQVAVYRELDRKLNEVTGSEVGLPVLVSKRPYEIPRADRPDESSRHETVRDFQRVVTELWLADELPHEFAAGWSWLPKVTRSAVGNVTAEQLLPRFYRTDESLSGKIFEIQYPGSWWGTHQALEEIALEPGGKLADRFAEELLALLPAGAQILHMFESASNPHENHFFAQRVRAGRPTLRFWGIDDCRSEECNFIRAHSYGALVAEDYFLSRLDQLCSGAVLFDHPPIPLFDQKLPMSLPFHPATRSYFSDAHRDLFPFTAIVGESVVALEGEGVVALRDFAARPAAGRDYYLKYAGADSSRAFGAKGVFGLRDLSPSCVATLLAKVRSDYSAGQFWILQSGVASADTITYVDKYGDDRTTPMHVKLSAFCGPSGQLGLMLLAGVASEVHWTESAVVALVKAV